MAISYIHNFHHFLYNNMFYVLIITTYIFL
jgi:hypothetical protein